MKRVPCNTVPSTNRVTVTVAHNNTGYHISTPTHPRHSWRSISISSYPWSPPPSAPSGSSTIFPLKVTHGAHFVSDIEPKNNLATYPQDIYSISNAQKKINTLKSSTGLQLGTDEPRSENCKAGGISSSTQVPQLYTKGSGNLTRILLKSFEWSV